VLPLSLLLLALPAAPAPDAPGAGGQVGQQAGTPHAPDQDADGALSGRWAMLQVLSNRSEVPFVGDAVANTRIVMLFDLVEREARLAGDGEVCLLDIVARPTLVRPVLPDTFRETVQRQRFEARIEREGESTRLRGVRQGSLLGLKLERPWRDPMPAPGSAAIVDTDGDGKPGMTMRVEGLFDIEFYLAQRQWTQLTGTERSDGSFSGPLRHHAEQVLLGADSILLQALPDMKPDPRASRFEMVRLESKATCDGAIAQMLPDEATRRGILRTPSLSSGAKPLPVRPTAAR
jgi:hypothetical protein